MPGVDELPLLPAMPNALMEAIAGARPAFELLGVPQRLGVHYAPHRHALTAEDWAALLDFADQQLFGRTVPRRFDQFPEPAR
jgi:hypothetical protein